MQFASAAMLRPRISSSGHITHLLTDIHGLLSELFLDHVQPQITALVQASLPLHPGHPHQRPRRGHHLAHPLNARVWEHEDPAEAA